MYIFFSYTIDFDYITLKTETGCYSVVHCWSLNIQVRTCMLCSFNNCLSVSYTAERYQASYCPETNISYKLCINS
jgi:hypothetical protein